MEKKNKIGIILGVIIILSGMLFIVFQERGPGSICFTNSQCSAPTWGYDPICDKGKCSYTNIRWCEINVECQWKCGYGCVNKNARLKKISGDMKYDCYPGMEKWYSCVCKENKCETINK